MEVRKYVSLSKLSLFLDNLSSKFAALTHTHKIEDISDFAVDSELSPDSINPVQNKVLSAELNTINEIIGVLETKVDGKSDSTHIHEISDVANLQDTIDNLQTNIDAIPQTKIQLITLEGND